MFGGFDKLTSRDETPSPKSSLNIILDTEEEILKKYTQDKRINDFDKLQNDLYLSILEDIREKIKDVTYTSETLQMYIDARENPFSDEGKIRGMYSGALLEILCKRSQDPISIDGKGKKWNYLFFHTKHLQNLSIRNFTGGHILSCIGSYKGSAKNISVKEIYGFRTLSCAGSVSGSVENLCCEFLQGDEILYHAGNEKGTLSNASLKFIKGDSILLGGAIDQGKIYNLYVENIEGRRNLAAMGREKGCIENVTVLNNKGHFFLSRLGESGTAKNIKVIKSEGNFLLSQEYQNNENGRLENVYVADSISDYLLQNVGRKKSVARNVILSNVEGSWILTESADKGMLENVIVIDSKGSHMLANSVTQSNYLPMPEKENNLRRIIIANGETDKLLECSGEKTIHPYFFGKAVTDVVTHNVTGFAIFDSATIENHNQAETFSKDKKIIFDTILRLVKEMKNMTITEQSEAHKKIEALHEELYT